MLRFAANLTMLFTERPLLDRFAAAAEAGFQGAEILFPYDIAARDLSRAAIAAGLELVLINTPPPNWAGGPRGFAAQPGQEARFRHDFDRALRFAQALRARHIHVMSGVASGPEARATLVENLRWATTRAPHASLTIEPINTTDMPGYYLDDFDLACGVIEEVGAANLGLQFDAYHARALGHDPAALWPKVAPLVRHVQIADWPGRHEPGTGRIDYPAFFAALEGSGYRGWIGAEYNPGQHTETGLGWLTLA